MDLNYSEVTSAVSIVLAILIYFLGVVHAETTATLKRVVPPSAQTESVKAFRKEIIIEIMLQNLPVTLGLAALFYLCLPASVAVVRTSEVALWDFDLLSTLLIALEVGVGCCLAFSAVLLFRLLCKRRKAK